VVTSAPILLAAGTQVQAPGVNLIAPNTKYQDRWNQLDLSAKRTFHVEKKEFQGQIAVFNVFNGSTVLQEVQTYGANLGQPPNVPKQRWMPSFTRSGTIALRRRICPTLRSIAPSASVSLIAP